MGRENTRDLRKKQLTERILKANLHVTGERFRRLKFKKMGKSAFAFYRATAYLFYEDLYNNEFVNSAPWRKTSEVYIWVQGDSHLQNVGFFGVGDKIYFDLNDFDETHIAPFYYDLLRFVTSLYVGRKFLKAKIKKREMTALADHFLETYHQAVMSYINNDREKKPAVDEGSGTGFAKEKMVEIRDKSNRAGLLKYFTAVEKGKRTLRRKADKVVDISTEESALLDKGWAGYVEKATASSGLPRSYFVVKDRARRYLSGLGSLGMTKYYLLLEGPTDSLDDDVIFEIKEQRTPALVAVRRHATLYDKLPFVHQGQRYVFAYRALAPAPDKRVDFLTIGKKGFVTIPFSPHYREVEGSDFKRVDDLRSFLTQAARALAAAHCRADRDKNQKGVLNNSFEDDCIKALSQWKDWKKVLLGLAREYGKQVKKDYKLYKKLVKEGAIK